MDVNAFKDRPLTRLSSEEMDIIRQSYTRVDFEGSFIEKSNEYANDEKYKWEMVSVKNYDSKYGRSMISREYKLIRGATMGEFYGSGIVD